MNKEILKNKIIKLELELEIHRKFNSNNPNIEHLNKKLITYKTLLNNI